VVASVAWCAIAVLRSASAAAVIIVDGAGRQIPRRRHITVTAPGSARPNRRQPIFAGHRRPGSPPPHRTLPRSPADIDRVTRVSGVRRGCTVDWFNINRTGQRRRRSSGAPGSAVIYCQAERAISIIPRSSSIFTVSHRLNMINSTGRRPSGPTTATSGRPAGFVGGRRRRSRRRGMMKRPILDAGPARLGPAGPPPAKLDVSYPSRVGAGRCREK